MALNEKAELLKHELNEINQKCNNFFNDFITSQHATKLDSMNEFNMVTKDYEKV